MLAIFSGLNIGLLDAYFSSRCIINQSLECIFQNFKISCISQKITWYILNFIEALAESQMKVKALLNIFYNFISNPCTMYVPIKYTNS